MRIPGPEPLIFLAYILGFLPWAAYRSARRLAEVREGTAPLPPRKAVWTGTLITQGLLLALALVTAIGFDYNIFALPSLGLREILAGVVALGVYLVLRSISRAVRSEQERRKMTVYVLAPRSGQEWALWAATVMVASVAEEAAYRGVGHSILWYSLGDPWSATLVCATAFAFAHSTQGWKSGVVIFAMALVMHALVAFTGTLVIAMVVHAIYDFVAGFRINRDAVRYEREAAAAG